MMKDVFKYSRKNLNQVLKANKEAMEATGSPASKMSSARTESLEAFAGHWDDSQQFIKPPFYTELEKAGWSKDAILATLRRMCAPKASMHKSNVSISTRLAMTLKTGDLSNGNDCTYDGCRGGITVFAVPPLSKEKAREKSLEQEAFEAATLRTQDETRKQMQGDKVNPPEDLREVIRYLNNYIVLLEVIAGSECPHLLLVLRLRNCLDEEEERFERALDKHKLLTILWRVHEDARQFCQRCERWSRGQPLPTSKLGGMVKLLEDSFDISHTPTCPYEKFYPKKDDTRTRGKKKGAGGNEKDEEEQSRRKIRGPQATINPDIPPLCVAAVKKFKAAHPGMTLTQFAAESGVPIRELLSGKRGGCSNFQLLGVCKEGCSYAHEAIVIPEGKQRDLSSALLRGMKAIEDKKKVTTP